MFTLEDDYDYVNILSRVVESLVKKDENYFNYNNQNYYEKRLGHISLIEINDLFDRGFILG